MHIFIREILILDDSGIIGVSEPNLGKALLGKKNIHKQNTKDLESVCKRQDLIGKLV